MKNLKFLKELTLYCSVLDKEHFFYISILMYFGYYVAQLDSEYSNKGLMWMTFLPEK